MHGWSKSTGVEEDVRAESPKLVSHFTNIFNLHMHYLKAGEKLIYILFSYAYFKLIFAFKN